MIMYLCSVVIIFYLFSYTGHSWGSAHDPGNDRECAFDYLMNEFAQDGSNTKHRVGCYTCHYILA